LNFGFGVLRPERLVMIGVRDLDPSEREALTLLGVVVFTREDVRRLGGAVVVAKALDHLSSCQDIHVSFDIDAIDPELAPTTGVPVEDGLVMTEVIEITRALGRSEQVRSVEVVEINPDLAANSWDWSLTVEIVRTITGELFQPQARTGFLDLRPSWRHWGRQLIERAFL
jgi:arginase